MAGGDLGSPDGGFTLDDVFLISDPLLPYRPLLGYFLVLEGFSDSGSQLAFVGGSKRSVLLVVEWPEMICVGQTKVGKMAAYGFSTAPMGVSLSFSGKGRLHRWWFSARRCRGYSKL